MSKKSIWFLFIIMVIAIHAKSVEKEYQQLTEEQREVLRMAYSFGKKYNLGYTMAAIVWQESFVGREIVPINLQDPAAGLWHKNVYAAVTTSPNIPNNGLQINMMADKLIEDVEFAASLAIADLEHWKVVRRGKWMDIWSSYHAGKYYQSEQGQRYADSIKSKIRILKKYILGSD